MHLFECRRKGTVMNVDVERRIGRNLRTLRERANMMQEAVAAMLRAVPWQRLK